jgi:predicted nucleic acid-binding protein
MTVGSTKYALDTNVFVRSFRDPDANAELQRFHLLFAPFEYLSSVVVQELVAGVATASDRRRLQRHLLGIYAKRRRVITPSAAAWERSGLVLAELAKREGLDLGRVSKAFANDVLLALACREAGIVLVTDNERDFRRIARVMPFEFVPARPLPG